MEQPKYFDNTILGQFALTEVPLKVYVNDEYLTITDPDDIEDPLVGFGMTVDGGMVPYDYRAIDHLLVGDNTITLDTYNKAMSGGDAGSKGSEEEAPEEEESGKEKKGGKEKEAGGGNPFEGKQNMKMKPMIEKAVSKAQQKLFGTALSVKRGDTDKKEVSKDVVTLAKSLSDKELSKFAGTKHKDLPEKKKQETNEDLGSAQKKLQKAKEERAKASAKEADAAAAVAKEEERMAKMSEEIGDINTISEPYTFQVGDIINNVNPNCMHFGSTGIVQKIIDLPNEMGQLIKYTVTNSGDTFKPGDSLTKTPDQLVTYGPSRVEYEDDMYDDDMYDDGEYDDWEIASQEDYKDKDWDDTDDWDD